jgi:hypothetical protein
MPGYTAVTNAPSVYDDLLHTSHDATLGTITIGSSTVDAGNTREGTSVLRIGMILAKATADGAYYPFNSALTDGTEDSTNLVVLAARVEMDGTNKAVVAAFTEGSFRSASLLGADIASVTWTDVQRLRRF